MGGRRCNKLQVLEMSEENGFSWTVKADLPAARGQQPRLVDSKLWLMGGLATGGAIWQTHVTVYDPANDTWATGTPLPRALDHCHAVMHD